MLAHWPIRLSRSRAFLLVLATALLALLLGSLRGAAGPAPARAEIVTQGPAEFAAGAAENLTTPEGLRLASDAQVDGAGALPHSGRYTSGPHRAASPFTSLTVGYLGATPAGSSVALEFRTAGPDGAWSFWTAVPPARVGEPIWLGATAVSWEYRATLAAPDLAQSPRVRSITVRTIPAPNSADTRIAALAAAPTYRVFATREGLVGGLTANGHVIKEHDHFVALPSASVLGCDGCYNFQVTVSYKGRTTTQPVWDIGPWNINDNYWHYPRSEFADLPLGVPGAQAAIQVGYNSGVDESGRQVLNPAGIDLADGVFWDDLGMTDNDWVDVTYTWEGGGASKGPGVKAPIAPPLTPPPSPTPVPPTATPTPPSPWPLLKDGQTGESVRTLLLLLAAHEYEVPDNDVYWVGTANLLKRFQAEMRIPVTGLSDTATWQALIPLIQPEDTGYGVRAVQSQLRAHGYTFSVGAAVLVDGVYGPVTESAVKSFQTAAGLPATGVVDTATWLALVR
jgi:hypothetical protein